MKVTLNSLQKKLIIAAGAVFVLFALFIVYQARSPVLIVSDFSSVTLYGKARVRSETRNASIALFRRVLNVSVADEASNDIIRFAVSESSSRPYCVIFPLRFARAARLYRENNSETPVILLEGRYGRDDTISAIGGSQNDYFIYKTDIDYDFQKAGMAAAALDMGKNDKIAVFLDQNIRSQAENSFLRTVNSPETRLDAVFFSSFDDHLEIPDISCVVFAGAGVEFLENNSNIPIIFFTWIDPSFLPDDVVIVIDDSPWAQIVQAVRMAGGRASQGRIKSKFHIVNKKIIDGKTLRNLRK